MSTSQPTEPGTGTETPITIPYPEAGDLHLRINEGACRLKIAPGAGDAWFSGAHRDPSGLRPLSITQEGGSVRLSEQASTSTAWEWLRSGHGVADVPTFDLALGDNKTVTFPTAGTYQITCTIHPSMQATITVTAA